MPPKLATTKWVSATLPKSGHRAEENEDAAAAAADGLRFALADGATEGWESASWAAHLAATLARIPPAPVGFAAWLGDTRRAWIAPPKQGSLPWYATVKQQEGSFAAIIGLELLPAGISGWGWKAVAVGDSCLLHVRNEGLREAFPLATPEAFGNRPPLVPSSPALACPNPEWLAGRAEPGDVFLLASDAAAAQLLRPSGLRSALPAVRESLGSGDTGPVLDWLRSVQAETNDDATLIGICLPSRETL